ncbi:ROK family protein [Chloroflexota bacterium]
MRNCELPVLTVDLGGTKILTALVSRNGEIMARGRCLTLADEGPTPVIGRLLSAVDSMLRLESLAPSEVDSISIAAAGAVDLDRGLVTLSPNLPGWHDVPLGEAVRERYGIKVFLVNDASAAALGEHHFGSGKRVTNLVFLTIGTGIGGGIIVNGKLYQGLSGSAGEIGHMTLDMNGLRCACGNIGCLETLASGTAIAREARHRLKQGEKSALTDIMAGKIGNITAEEVGAAAGDGDSLALDIITRAGTYLGVGMVNLVNIFNPEMIVVGGGVARLAELLLEPARQAVWERAFPVSAKAVRIVAARLGEEAGIYGAAAYAFEQGE